MRGGLAGVVGVPIGSRKLLDMGMIRLHTCQAISGVSGKYYDYDRRRVCGKDYFTRVMLFDAAINSSYRSSFISFIKFSCMYICLSKMTQN